MLVLPGEGSTVCVDSPSLDQDGITVSWCHFPRFPAGSHTVSSLTLQFLNIYIPSVHANWGSHW